jgi:TRAP-type mannitol/chloroaromatic compound transport system permease small subunit
MISPSEHETGFRPLDVAAGVLERVTALTSMVGTVGILALMLLISSDVVGRFGFGRPIAGVPEMVAMSILAIVFLQIANTLARGKLTRSDAFLGLLRRRRRRLADFIDAAMHAAGAVLVGILITAFYPLFLRSYGRGETVGTVGQFIAPIWPVHLIVLIGSALLFLVFLQRTISLLVLAAAPDREANE